MNIQDQLSLFFRRFGEGSDNARLEPEEALAYINGSRRSLSAELKFYNTEDYAVCVGTETYWTLRDDFFGPRPNVRDWVTYDDYPVAVKYLGNWASLTNNSILRIYDNSSLRGMLENKIFHIDFTPTAGKRIKWLGYGRPPALGALTGPDAYLTDTQAELTVLDAVMDAKEDTGDRIGQRLYDKWKALKISVVSAAEAKGPRLEEPPDNYGY